MKILFSFLTIFCTPNILGQSITIEELIKINKMPLDDIETILMKKNFSLANTSKDSLTTTIKYENKNSELAITITKYEKPNIFIIEYLTFQKGEYLKAKEYCKIKKFKLLGTKVGKGEISNIATSYLLNGCLIKLTSNSTLAQDGQSNLNWYAIKIDDSNNYGLKK